MNPLDLWKAIVPPPESKTELGEAAKQLLADPVLHLALRRVEEKLVATWRQTAVGEQEAREAAYALLCGLEQFKGELRLMIAEAGMAARERPSRAGQ